MKMSFSGTPKILTFSLRSPTFRKELQQLTLVLKITFDNLKCEIVRLNLHSWYLDLNWWKHDFPIWTRRTSASSPKGPLIWRKGGECFAPLTYHHLLCAAARRKHRKRPPEPSGDGRKPWKCHLLGHLKFQHFHFRGNTFSLWKLFILKLRYDIFLHITSWKEYIFCSTIKFSMICKKTVRNYDV